MDGLGFEATAKGSLEQKGAALHVATIKIPNQGKHIAKKIGAY